MGEGGGEGERGKLWNFLLFLRMLLYYSRIIRGISIDPVAHPEETRRAQHPKADRINSSRGIGLAVENAERLSRSRQQRSLSATFGAPWSAVEKYMCNRSTASLVYACHANAYARHVRFPGVTAPSLVVIRVPRLLPALVRPINAKKKKNYLPITDRATESVVSRSYPNSVNIYLDARRYIAVSRVHTSFILALTTLE